MATKVISHIKVDERKKLDVRSGDQVRVWQKIEEDKGKFRLQAFEGLVLARKHGSEAGATFTVRKVVGGIGVERTFPLHSPMIDEIELVRRSKVRRAKLYFIREKATKEIRKQMRRVMTLKEVQTDTVEAAAPQAQSEAEKTA